MPSVRKQKIQHSKPVIRLMQYGENILDLPASDKQAIEHVTSLFVNTD